MTDFYCSLEEILTISVSVHRFRSSGFKGFGLQSSPFPPWQYVLFCRRQGYLTAISSNRIILIFFPSCLDTEMARLDSVHQSTGLSLHEPGTLNIEPLSGYPSPKAAQLLTRTHLVTRTPQRVTRTLQPATCNAQPATRNPQLNLAIPDNSNN